MKDHLVLSSPAMGKKSWLLISKGKTVAGLPILPVWIWHHSLKHRIIKYGRFCGIAAPGEVFDKGLCISFPQTGEEMVLWTEREKIAVGVAFTHSHRSGWTILTVDMKSSFE